eukprot:TRINITY_DN59729_c0_g1_i1.p1 TRINITY_DN59729_c0_g1~~TRINITY_DN59729_c0_g1_i1.p1  ORF type:complete len:190 (+),score=31.78 TRINITY_DN59729_c0_g1_i1:129-698(+)
MVASFEFPPFYSLPPFFTLQPHAGVRAKQLTLWRQMLCSYCAHHRLFILDVSDAGVSQQELFNNKGLQRQLSSEGVRALAEHVVAEGVAVWLSGDGGGSVTGSSRLLILWRSANEWADLILKWAESTGRIGSVETIFSLSEGESTEDEAFHGAPHELIMVALEELARRGRATIFRGQQTASQGVKFLPA